MIEVRDLRKSYDEVVALKGISFTIDKGEIVGFLGPNGAGKSTTMKIITCFMPQTAGTVKVEGFDVNSHPLEVRRRIGYLPESTPLYLDMLVYDYLRYVAKIRGVPKKDIPGRIKKVCEMCGLTKRAGQLIGTLSKGFKQRVGLAQALIHDPEILILDEPTSGLDPNQIVEIRNLIKELGKDRTVILSTHNLPEVMATCNRMLIVHDGKLVADGTPAELQAKEDEHAHVRVVLKGANGEAKSALEQLGSVASVEEGVTAEPGAIAYQVLGEGQQDPREAIFNLAVDKGWQLVELHRDVLDLEGIFRKLTREV